MLWSQNIEQISAAELKDTLLAVNGAGVLEKFNGDFDSLIDPTTSHLSGGKFKKLHYVGRYFQSAG